MKGGGVGAAIHNSKILTFMKIAIFLQFKELLLFFSKNAAVSRFLLALTFSVHSVDKTVPDESNLKKTSSIGALTRASTARRYLPYSLTQRPFC